VIAKVIDHLDGHCRAFLALSPFMTLGTQSADGQGDVSPRGDQPGFALVLDDRTLAFPDRPGNNRLDSLRNIVASPGVGLLFFIPGFEETLRINGNAHLSTDPDLLARMMVDGKPPRTFPVGSPVDGSSVLQKVSARGVEIGPRGGAPLVTLELSPLAPAATGRPGVTAPAPSPAPALAKPVPGNAGVPPGTEGQPLPEALRRPGLANR
jgi:predicted pyridoxine 5'-phosphate oxidase superfamily flavin-nucleotide-binding protein